MKKIFLAITAVTAALFISGCSSEEPPSELDIIIDNLQTSNLPPETEPEDVTTPEETEDAEITVSDNGADAVYNSLTGIVLSADEDHLSIESSGIRYDILIGKDTKIFGGAVSEEKTVTVTYISIDSDTDENITAIAITILQEESSEPE